MGNNKQFNNILDECLERLLTGQETVEQCLQRYPEYATELEPLLRTAALMKKTVEVEPSADFRAKARYQMQLKMAESKAPQRAVRFVPRWAIAVCAIMLVFVLGGGTVLAANGSMPGSPLYGVKLATENLSIKLAGSEEKKAELYVTMANRRVTEMVWMVDNGKTQNIEAAATRLNNYYTKIGELPLAGSTERLASGATATGNQSQSANVWGFSMTTETPLASTVTATTAVPTTTPPVSTVTATTPVTGAGEKNTVTTTEPSTTAVTSTIVPTLILPVPTVTVVQPPASANGITLNANDTAKLMNILIYNSVTQPEEIQKLLDSDKVPESVKPALRLALAEAEIGYQNAINNLSH